MGDGFASSQNAPSSLGRPSLDRHRRGGLLLRPSLQDLAFRGWTGLTAMAMPGSWLLATLEEHPLFPAETKYQNHAGQSQEAGSGTSRRH